MWSSGFNYFRWSEILLRMGKRPEIAPTPSEVIWRMQRVKLRHYLPVARRTHPTPVLIVYSLINKYYILDLMPGKSYIEYLVGQGFEVYLIDWGEPKAADRRITLEDHIDGYIADAVAQTLEHAGAKQLAMIGYCMGGTMALIYAALHPQRLKSLVLLATPVDFHNDSLLSVWARREYFDVDKFVDTYGNANAEVLKATFSLLKPTRNITKYTDLMERMHDEEFVKTFLAFDYWVNDQVSVPGETFRKFIRDTYQDNLLVQNRMRLGERTINLKKVRCPVLNVVAEYDDIVPPASASVALELIGSRKKEELRFKGGHHGITIGSTAQKLVWPKSAEWLRN